MKNGTYRYGITMSVPLGKRNGDLYINLTDDRVYGNLTMFTETLPIREGNCTGNKITFSGEMKTLMNTFSYVADGVIELEQIELLFHTERGDFPAVGQKSF